MNQVTLQLNDVDDMQPRIQLWNEQDSTTIKLAKGLVISNFLAFIFLFHDIVFIYVALLYNWNDHFITSFQLFIFSDILLLGEKILFFDAILNKRNIIKLCPIVNLFSLLLKFIASGFVVYFIPFEIILSLFFIILQIPHNLLIEIISKRWNHIPVSQWKKIFRVIKKPAISNN